MNEIVTLADSLKAWVTPVTQQVMQAAQNQIEATIVTNTAMLVILGILFAVSLLIILVTVGIRCRVLLYRPWPDYEVMFTIGGAATFIIGIILIALIVQRIQLINAPDYYALQSIRRLIQGCRGCR